MPGKDGLVFGRRLSPPLVPSRFVARTAAFGLSRMGLRLVPYVGTALLAYDLYQWWSSQFWVPGFENCGQRNIDDCKAGGELLNLRVNVARADSGASICPSGTTCANAQGFTPWGDVIGAGVNSFTGMTYFKWSVNNGEYAAEHTYWRRTHVLPSAYAPTVYATAFGDTRSPWAPQPRPYRGGRTRRYPHIDPMSEPIGGGPRPIGDPIPWDALPHRVDNPYRSPSERTDWGPEPTFKPSPRLKPGDKWPWFLPQPDPDVETKPKPKTGEPPQPKPVPYVPLLPPYEPPQPYVPEPYSPPVVELPSPGRPLPRVGRPTPRRHWPRRPKPGEKETKYSLHGGRFGRIYGMVTEIEDFANAFYYAIPLYRRCPGAPLGYETADGRQITHAVAARVLTKHKVYTDNAATFERRDQHKQPGDRRYQPTKQYQHTVVGAGGTAPRPTKGQALCNHRPGLHTKLRMVYDNWEHIKHRDVLRNLLINEFGDRIGGALGRTTRKANKKRGAPAGISFGPLH